MPTLDERKLINQLKIANPDTPLAPAEDFCHTLASIPELDARLNLLRFSSVFQQVEEVHVCMCVHTIMMMVML